MVGVSAQLRQFVIERAGNHCEYCGLSQEGQEATFHVDHIQPVSAGGKTNPDNLALACVSCSLRKGARQTAVDPASGRDEPLFNPRHEAWPHHFQYRGAVLESLTPTGRATIALLQMNRPLILAIRQEEALRGRHPPPFGSPFVK